MSTPNVSISHSHVGLRWGNERAPLRLRAGCAPDGGLFPSEGYGLGRSVPDDSEGILERLCGACVKLLTPTVREQLKLDC